LYRCATLCLLLFNLTKTNYVGTYFSTLCCKNQQWFTFVAHPVETSQNICIILCIIYTGTVVFSTMHVI